MASYEYSCKKCSNNVIINRSISEKDPGYLCEKCNLPMSKVYSGSKIGITFNGSGFYSKEK